MSSSIMAMLKGELISTVLTMMVQWSDLHETIGLVLVIQHRLQGHVQDPLWYVVLDLKTTLISTWVY